MASKRKLKKKIAYVASELFVAGLTEGIDRESVVDSVHRVLALVPRISHPEPGNTKGFYKKLAEDLEKEVGTVVDELAKAAKA